MLGNYDVWLASAQRSLNTRESYLRDVRLFISYIGDSEVDENAVGVYLGYLIAQGRTGSTVKRVLAALRNYYDYLVSIGEIRVNPARECVVPESVYYKHTPTHPDESDISALLSCVEQQGSARDVALLSLMCFTGASVSEISALTIGDIDIRSATVHYGTRTVYLTENVLSVVQRYLAELHNSGGTVPVFAGRSGSGITRQGVWLICKKWSECAGVCVSLSPRLLRRVFVENSDDFKRVAVNW